jgi:hypothetical protein
LLLDSTVVGNLPTKLDRKPLSDITQSQLNHSSTYGDNSTAPPLKKRGRPRKDQSLPVVQIKSSTNDGIQINGSPVIQLSQQSMIRQSHKKKTVQCFL